MSGPMGQPGHPGRPGHPGINGLKGKTSFRANSMLLRLFCRMLKNVHLSTGEPGLDGEKGNPGRTTIGDQGLPGPPGKVNTCGNSVSENNVEAD